MTSLAQPVEVVPYNPDWPRQFAEINEILMEKLGPFVSHIEHVGSTAIPGLAAKPIIDIDVVLAPSAELPEVIVSLQTLGYMHQGDLGISGREAFKRLDDNIPRDGSGRVWAVHHLYVCQTDNSELNRHLAFRDYLRQHPDEVATYSSLKQRLAAQFTHDRASYTKAKTEFIVAILQRATPELI